MAVTSPWDREKEPARRRKRRKKGEDALAYLVLIKV